MNRNARGRLRLALIFAASAIFGSYRMGIEWGFWPGQKSAPACSTTRARSPISLKQVQSAKIAPCDAPALRILGLSLAGWNALISAELAALAVLGLHDKF
jgi:disulfide bond formation protein DsbB